MRQETATLLVENDLTPSGTATRRARRSGRRNRHDVITAILFLAPAVLAAVALRIWPTEQAVQTSLQQGHGGLGLGNYSYLFGDPAFRKSLEVTLIYTLIVNPFQIALALSLAMVLKARFRLVGLMRTLIFLPIAIPQTVSAIIWGIAMRPDGPLNALLREIGIPPQPWLTSPHQALPSIILIVSWVGVGYYTTFLIAGLLDIPTEYYEAAAIDGATRVRSLWHVTLPLLRPHLLFVLVADTVANFLVFAPVQILTNGGPQGSTDLIMNDIYQRAYTAGDSSAAAAETVVLVLIVLSIVLVQFRLLTRGEK